MGSRRLLLPILNFPLPRTLSRISSLTWRVSCQIVMEQSHDQAALARRFWISDEYGPYIYRYSADGKLIQTIQPPNAFLPRDSSGALQFTSDTDPKTGRAGNKGFEGLTIDRTNNIFGRWVVPLPLSSKGNTLGCSEIHFVSPGVFLALSRDGDGRGGDDTNSKYKQAELFSLVGATDIHGTKYDDPATPVAPGGKLVSSIKPATYLSFVSYVETNGLARFGLHNGEPAYPDDFFLFTAADNDFISTDGVSLDVPFNAGLDVDNQFLVYRVTFPGAAKYHV
ncbi:hypothetical protein FPV67DRAFT_1446478 [Lyophyllum atratum]|nr:hypothetical protein FPV67DRAFT_1446478 [Lyophyllum atratum]